MAATPIGSAPSSIGAGLPRVTPIGSGAASGATPIGSGGSATPSRIGQGNRRTPIGGARRQAAQQVLSGKSYQSLILPAAKGPARLPKGGSVVSGGDTPRPTRMPKGAQIISGGG